MPQTSGLLFGPNPSMKNKDINRIKGVKHSITDAEYTRKHPFDEHMLLLLSKSEDIISFFRIINEYGDKVIDREAKKYEQGYSEDCKKYIEERKKLGILMKRLEDAGIELASKPGSRSSYEAEKADRSDVGLGDPSSTRVGRSKFEFRTVIYKSTFNGLAISKEMIDTDAQELRDQTRRWEAVHPDIDETIAQNHSQLNRARWRLFIPRLLGNQEASDEIERFKDEEESLQETKRDGKELKERLEKFDSFSQEEKALIKEYLGVVDSLVITGNALADKAKAFDELGRLRYSKQTMLDYSYIWQAAVSDAKADGRITDEDLSRVHQFFTREINLSHKVDYQGGMSYYSKDVPEGININSFRWFMVKSVFEELKQQKQNELDTQGLIRKTEELIGAENFLIRGPLKKGDIVRKIEGDDLDEEK